MRRVQYSINIRLFVLYTAMMDETVQSRGAGAPTHASLDGRGTRQPGFELLIGSNLFRDTNGVVKIQGKEQLVLELKPEQGLLLATMDLYSENGIHIAHLRRNAFMLNQSGQFAVEVHRSQGEMHGDHPWVRLLDQQSHSPVLEIRMVSENRVHILSGKFYSHRGALVEITPHYCRIGSSSTLFGDIVENRGGMIVLGPELSQPFLGRP